MWLEELRNVHIDVSIANAALWHLTLAQAAISAYPRDEPWTSTTTPKKRTGITRKSRPNLPHTHVTPGNQSFSTGAHTTARNNITVLLFGYDILPENVPLPWCPHRPGPSGTLYGTSSYPAWPTALWLSRWWLWPSGCCRRCCCRPGRGPAVRRGRWRPAGCPCTSRQGWSSRRASPRCPSLPPSRPWSPAAADALRLALY